MTGAKGLALVLALLPAAGWAQVVQDCDPVPAVTDLIEPWEDTAAALAGGAVRLAVLEGEQGARHLLVLTLPPPELSEAAAPVPVPVPVPVPLPADPAAPAPEDQPVPDAALASDPAAPPPERRCRVVAEGGLGFADLDLAGIEAAEDPEAATLTVRVPALGFVPESTELLPQTLVLTLGVADQSLAAAVE